MSAPAVGQRVAERYLIDGRIGAGGHGEIWSAVDVFDGERIALKFLREDIAASVGAWDVLNHESQMARRLNHPGILRTGTPLRDGDRTVLPMEYAGGGDLRRLRGQSYMRSVPVLIRIAEILAHAHERDVIHRDLKPGNVLFDSQGGVRLADFGASGLSGSTHLLAQGSPFYASPQQLQDLAASPADDVYGLGALAYELLSGQPPFYPDFSVERVLNEPVPAPRPTLPAPGRLLTLIESMLDKDPAQRPANMAEVIEGFNQALSDTVADATLPALVLDGFEPLAVSGDEPPVASAPPIATSRPAATRVEPYHLPLRTDSAGRARGSRPRSTGAWSLGVLIVAALGLGVWLQQKREHERERRVAAASPVSEAAPVSAPAASPPPAPPAPPPADVLAPPPATTAPADAPAPAPELAAAPRLPSPSPSPAAPAASASDTESLRLRAVSFERQERWREARDAYGELQALDPAVRGVDQGLRRASERADLSDRLDEYLVSPSALRLPAGRGEARALLSLARRFEAGPVLRSQIARIELMLEQAEADGAGDARPPAPSPAAAVASPPPDFSSR